MSAPPLSCPTRVDYALSVVCVDLVQLDRCLRQLPDLGIGRLHVDIIDTSFGNLGLAPQLVSDLCASFSYPIDVHLMVDKPAAFIGELVSRGADSVTVHQRAATPLVVQSLSAARERGCRVGIAIDPGEHIHRPLVAELRPDQLTVMTVVPGGAGRPFRPEALATIEQAALLRDAGLVGLVEVDGAIGPATAPAITFSGADRLVLGSTAFPRRDLTDHRMAELDRAISDVVNTGGSLA